ncbi:hypothetical protein JCM11251_004694 [Rhodosporidiobolus azoricus]
MLSTQDHRSRPPRLATAALSAEPYRINSGERPGGGTEQTPPSPSRPAHSGQSQQQHSGYGRRGGLSGHGGSRGGAARSSRPPSGLSSQSNPSLLSLEQQPPSSPATTVDTFPHSHHYQQHLHPHPHLQHLPHHPANLSRYGPPPHHVQQHPSHDPYRHSQPHLSPSHSPSSSVIAAPSGPSSRSHRSLPAPASASSSAANLGYAPGRHYQQMNRAYGKSGAGDRYDADFDRSAGGASAAAGPSRELFNPNGPLTSSASASTMHLPPAPVPPHASSSSPSHHAHPDPRSRSKDRKHRDRQTSDRPDRPDRQDRPQRSKREPVDPADLGRRAFPAQANAGERGKDSKESLAESVETDFSARTKSSGGGASRRRRRREGDEEGGEGVEAASGGGKNRQLFDPRRDDPMRFTPGVGPAGGSSSKKGGLAADARSLAAQSVASFASDAASDYPSPSHGDDGASVVTGLSGTSNRTRGKEPHPALAQIRRVYKQIQELEGRCAEEGRAAQAAREREREEEEGGVAGGGGGKGGVRLQKKEVKGWDDEYWVRVAGVHKQLADAHYSFLQLSLDPRLPASLHQLPQRYNIPTRLWQVAFHRLLERMRHAVLSSPLPSTTSATAGGEGEANVLDHLIEFIQYAYGHYSQLFEDPSVSVFRAAWIEQLGDLARYRMAVAGLASRRTHAAQAAAAKAAGASAGAGASQPQALSAANLAAAATNKLPPSPTADAALAPPVPAPASIGLPALDSWDLEEQETWREIAREWYGLGVSENPGTGRLQHHLALLAGAGGGGAGGGKGGDELRGVYGLTAAHPYLSARESILPLFDTDQQTRRTLPEVSKPDLFVHLHGMLFTKIQLDDFDEVLERFLERLREEGWALGKGRDGREGGGKGELPFGDKEWFMLAVVNVGALLQYGAEDGVLRRFMVRDTDEGKKDGAKQGGGGGKHGSGGGAGRRMTPAEALAAKFRAAPPQAIMVKRDEDADGLGGEDGGDGEDVLKPLYPNGVSSASSSPDDDPLPVKLAQRLSFRLLSFVIRDTNPFRRIGNAMVLNPYITILLTFLAHLSHHPAAFAHLEREVPWADVVYLLNLIPSSEEGGAEIRVADAPNKLVGGRPLPEDWCMRGMEWAGRQLYGRGYWREARPGGRGGAEHLPPPIEGVDAPSVRVESEMDALKFDLSALTQAASTDDHASSGGEGEFEPPETSTTAASSTPPAAVALATGRWRRLALCGAWLVRNVPGLDFDPYPRIDYDAEEGEEEVGRFRIAEPLRGKMERWRREDEVEREAERVAKLSLRERNGGFVSEEAEEEESDEEDEENEEDSDAVKELKARRRALKAVIRQARQATSRSAAPGRRAANSLAKLGSKAASVPKVFPGFTVLVFDTNILLTSIKLFRELIEAECWTVVVPLAVITELDGLKRNPTALGLAAVEVIDYLEVAIHAHSRYLKIQTSRGNYLKDLAIRNESIDFASSAASSSSFDPLDPYSVDSASHEHARTMDDVILRAVSWQSQHFTSRLALVNPRAIQAGFKVPTETAQVVLVTFDRNLRLKARARGLEATDEKGLKKAVDAAPKLPASGG